MAKPAARDLDDDMRLASLGDDAYAKAVRDASRVVQPKEGDTDHSRSK